MFFLVSMSLKQTWLKVTQDMNLGQWLNSEYSDRDKFERVISRIVHSRVAPPVQEVTVIPTDSVNDMVVTVDQLDYSVSAKHGCYQDALL